MTNRTPARTWAPTGQEGSERVQPPALARRAGVSQAGSDGSLPVSTPNKFADFNQRMNDAARHMASTNVTMSLQRPGSIGNNRIPGTDDPVA